MRWAIVRTLLAKEVLRFRYNWGLLLMVGAVLALSALVSLGDRMGEIPGQSGRIIKIAIIAYDQTNPVETRWAEALLNQRPQWFTEKNRIPFFKYHDSAWRFQRGLVYPDDYLMINLFANREPSNAPWKVTYDYQAPSRHEAMYYRLWVNQVTENVRGRKLVQEVLPRFNAEEQSATEDRLPKIVTALVIFAFYLLSFNLYITSTAEEREKKSLLALMLTPARPLEIIGAKVIFYSLGSLLVAAGVIALFDPSLLALPLLWTTIFSGSVSYISIGTVVLCLVKRQSTINTVSMMYLLVTSLIMAVSVFLIPFMILRFLMIENYLFHQLEMIIGRKPNTVAHIYQPIMLGLTAGWFCLAVFIFSRLGMSIATGRK